MARFYASDVLYKATRCPLIAGALHGAGIAVGGANGSPINGDQFLPEPPVADPVVHRRPAPRAARPAQHQGGKRAARPARPLARLGQRRRHQLQTGSTNTIPAKPAAHVHAELHQRRHQHRAQRRLQGDGHGTSVSGQTTVPETTAGQHATCKVHAQPRRRPAPTPDGDDRARSRARRTPPTTRCRSRSRSSSAPRRGPQVGPPTRAALSFQRCMTEQHRRDRRDRRGGGRGRGAARLRSCWPSGSAGCEPTSGWCSATGARTSSPTPRRCSASSTALHDYVQRRRRAARPADGDRRAAARRRGRLPRAGPLRRLRRDVRPPVDLDRAAGLPSARDGAVLDPPPRSGAAVRQAALRGPGRARALARGGRGGPAARSRATASPAGPA